MPFAVQFIGKMLSSADCPELDADSRKTIDSMVPDSGDWKERRLDELLKEVSKTDFHAIAEGIGGECGEGLLRIKYMGRDISVRHSGFDEKLNIWDKLLLLIYIRQAGKGPLSGKWAAFRDLKDGIIRSESFHGACELSLAGIFGRDKEGLINKLTAMGAEEASGFSADHSFIVFPLPSIPFLVLLWSGDEDFGPDCKILFDSTVTEFMDVEALLYLGIAFVSALR